MDTDPGAPIDEPKNGDGTQSNQPEAHQTAGASRVSPDPQGLALRFRESIVAKLAEGGEKKTAAKLDERTVNDGENNDTDSDSLLPLYDQTRPFIFDAVKAIRDLIVVASKIQSDLYPEIAQGLKSMYHIPPPVTLLELIERFSRLEMKKERQQLFDGLNELRKFEVGIMAAKISVKATSAMKDMESSGLSPNMKVAELANTDELTDLAVSTNTLHISVCTKNIELLLQTLDAELDTWNGHGMSSESNSFDCVGKRIEDSWQEMVSGALNNDGRTGGKSYRIKVCETLKLELATEEVRSLLQHYHQLHAVLARLEERKHADANKYGQKKEDRESFCGVCMLLAYDFSTNRQFTSHVAAHASGPLSATRACICGGHFPTGELLAEHCESYGKVETHRLAANLLD